jgi:hypothetical protein
MERRGWRQLEEGQHAEEGLEVARGGRRVEEGLDAAGQHAEEGLEAARGVGGRVYVV